MKNKLNCGVYEIVCDENSLKYIGASEDVEKRLKQHFYLLRENIHDCKRLQQDFNYYGEEKFYGELVEKCKSYKIAEQKEKLFIEHEKPDRLYNKRLIPSQAGGWRIENIQLNIHVSEADNQKMIKICNKVGLSRQKWIKGLITKALREANV